MARVPIDSKAFDTIGVNPGMNRPNSAGSGSSSASSASSSSLAPDSSAAATPSSHVPTASSYCAPFVYSQPSPEMPSLAQSVTTPVPTEMAR